jgi:hypothetical protein
LKRLTGLMIVLAARSAWAASAKAGAGEQVVPGGATAGELTPQQAMLWKYTARCALRADQELTAPSGPGGAPMKLKGALGLGPEWLAGKCDSACQQKVSSCLAAHTNQTGLHVQVSLLSAAASLAPLMSANDGDLPYPFQEGAFFGNVFAGEAYVCRGRDAADKAAQVKRFCALNPALCSGSGIAEFTDAGLCEQSCDMKCSRLSDGSSRCAAVRCRDPKGRVWEHPITTYLRNRIEAGNADTITGAVSRDSGLEELKDGGEALYRHVDFGREPGTIRSVVARVAAPEGGGHIEIWVDGVRRLGSLAVKSTRGAEKEMTAPLEAGALWGQHDIVLKFAGLHGGVRVTDIGLR